MPGSVLCDAIRSMHLIQFNYDDASRGTRVVEPHMVAYNSRDHLVLSAWFLGGASDSRDGAGWREYRLSNIRSVVVLPERFTGPRPGYRPDGGKAFHNIQCAL
jgi:predicted DNA-binding transcriptional regulator YafY